MEDTCAGAGDGMSSTLHLNLINSSHTHWFLELQILWNGSFPNYQNLLHVDLLHHIKKVFSMMTLILTPLMRM